MSRLGRLFRPVDGSSLAAFRVGFGLIMLWECWRYWSHGWIARYWIDPVWNFPYPGFEWLTPWPGDGMYWHFAGLAVLSVLIATGLFYRAAMLLFFLGFSYVFLLDEARYLNHFYLVCLVAFVMIFVPCHRSFSLDARRKPGSGDVPAWSVWLLRFMIGLPYFFGGIAKLNADWVFGAQPMGMWLAEREDIPGIGPWLSDPTWAMPSAYAFAWGGLALDLFAVPLLLWSRSRPWYLLMILLFHFLNSRLFHIGIFPWFMVWATSVFFPPDWPRRLAANLSERGALAALPTLLAALACGVAAVLFLDEFAFVPFLAASMAGALIHTTLVARLRSRAPGSNPVAALFAPDPDAPVRGPAPARLSGAQLATAGLLGAWVLAHCLIPLRHLAIPGDVNWTEEGHRFSWHMKLRDKDADVVFQALDPRSQQVIQIRPRDYLARHQARKMARRPYMIRQFAQHLRENLETHGMRGAEIRVRARVSLNGRETQLMIDPEVDVAAQPHSWWKADWILPLEQPLPRRPFYLD